MHVYHYNHYEPTSIDHLTELHATREEAVGLLMGRFSTREGEVDDLFRQRVFVDLYRVVRQGLRAGVESYSIKRLEPLVGFDRQVELNEATEHLIAFEVALDDGRAAEADENRAVVAGYNEDDCRATVALRDWLEARRVELEHKVGVPLRRPHLFDAPEEVESSEAALLRDRLLESVPADPVLYSHHDKAKVLLGDLLEWHRREVKPAWWHFFHLHDLSGAELVAEPDALGLLSGGEVLSTVKRSNIRRFSFPAQEHRFSAGDKAIDPDNGRTWSIWEIHEGLGEVELKVDQRYDGPLPTSLIPVGPPSTKDHATRLFELGRRALDDGLDGNSAVEALLLRRRPNGDGATGGPLQAEEEDVPAAAVRLCLGSRRSYLPIQGPPGTGKTHTGARQILAPCSKSNVPLASRARRTP